MDSAWDQLLDLVERLATDPTRALDPDVERTLTTLTLEAITARDVDTELHAGDVARWLGGLVVAHRSVRATHPEVDPDTDLADLRRIVTRWLHPARPR